MGPLQSTIYCHFFYFAFMTYLSFISFLYLDSYALGDDALIS